MPRPKVFTVELTSADRDELQRVVSTGVHPARMIMRARLLLELDENHHDQVDDQVVVAERVGVSTTTVRQVAKRFVATGGDVTATISRKQRAAPPVASILTILTGDVEARLIALACTKPPVGYSRWSLRLLEKHVALVEDLPDLDHSTIGVESGARTKAERDLAKRAEVILLALSPSERDRLGFSSKNAAKLQVLEPHLDGASGSRADRLAREVANLEQERFGLLREQRYATAARRLRDGGLTRAAVSRHLGISNSILDRITATHQRDVVLAMDDPIVTDLGVDML